MATINPKQPVQVFRVVDSSREIIDDFGGGVSSTAIATRQPVTVVQFVDSDGNIVDDFLQNLTGYQPLDSDLTAIAALATTSFGRSVLIQADAAAVRTLIGAGSSSFSGAFGSLSGIPTTLNGYGITDAQPLDSDLTAIAALTTTSYGRAFLALADAAAGRTALGLGTLATQSGTFSGTSSGTNTGDQNLSGYAPLASPTFTGTVTLPSGQALVAPALGTPASGTLTNCTSLPESGVTNLTSDLALKAPLASPTLTGTVTLPNSQALVTPVLGTPTSGTLTNCTGLPESGVTSLVSDLALKATLASPTFTGTVVLPNSQALVTPVLGTPTSGTLTNCTGLPESGVTSLVSDLALKAPLASPTFTGTVVLPSGQALIAPALGTPASGTINDSLTYGHDLTAVPNQSGGWTEYFVTGSAVNISTTTGTGDVVTGLTTGTLGNSTKYEIDVLLHVVNAADANGMKVTVNGGGSGSTLNAALSVTGTAATLQSATMNTIDTLSAAFVAASSIPGIVRINGFVTTGATAAVINIKCAKVTGNTATVQVGSRFNIRKAHT